MFSSQNNMGFQVTFENGWTVSVNWAPWNNCRAGGQVEPNIRWESEDAEIAAWKETDSGRVWHDFGFDQVMGYATPSEVLDFMNKVATFEVRRQNDTAAVCHHSYDTKSI